MDLDLLSPRERLELLTAYLDGELADPQARDVTAWLERHPEALREIEHQRRLWDLLGRYGDEPVPAQFVPSVLAAAGLGAAGLGPAPQVSGRPRLWRNVWAVTAAACALLAVGVAVLALRRGPAAGDLGEPLAGIDVEYVQNASLDDLLALSDAQFEALLTEDPDELADASLGG